MTLSAWLAALPSRGVPSTELVYDHMPSQSDWSLPLIYCPYDLDDPAHWRDRGLVLDFQQAAGRGVVLDFGPGDGWPALHLAPSVDQVLAVDASKTRLAVVQENARRLGLTNVHTLAKSVAGPLPLPEASVDGIVAASSVE